MNSNQRWTFLYYYYFTMLHLLRVWLIRKVEDKLMESGGFINTRSFGALWGGLVHCTRWGPLGPHWCNVHDGLLRADIARGTAQRRCTTKKKIKLFW